LVDEKGKMIVSKIEKL